eukprot:TRINITY_DN8183_c0_g1_i1.p1 TRINITY_DN8183_c0_g1~~TRINITY_DN8183_c0_g1_i1.p1  ORF type:complete len:483 (+),score=120.49 TRINITY_DN8183_c0_g1_i1:63-1511(+)
MQGSKAVVKEAKILQGHSDVVYSEANALYLLPPTDGQEELSIEEFERFGLDRIHVLQELEGIQLTVNDKKTRQSKTETLLNKFLPLRGTEGYRKDIVSHFVLRLAFCRPNDRKWFLTQECALLKARLSYYPGGIQTFAEHNRLNFNLISAEEYEELRQELEEVEASSNTGASSTSAGEVPKYFKVSFEEVLDLVRHRRVFLKGGNAYVRDSDYSSIVLSRYRQHLSAALATAYKHFASVTEQNDSIRPILNSLSIRYKASDYNVDSAKRSGAVQLNQLPMLADRSFPLCMKNMYEKLKEEHKLKHMGRMQFGLFLKGIGVKLEDALVFWKTEFLKGGMAEKKFDTAYAYNIRHNYGKEGKGTDYTPYSCVKIILSDYPVGEHAGCPFKHFEPDNLRAKMTNYGVKREAVNEILGMVKNQHYQIACRKYFEYTHPNNTTEILNITHPNQYFDLSEKHFNGGVAVEKGWKKPQTSKDEVSAMEI